MLATSWRAARPAAAPRSAVPSPRSPAPQLAILFSALYGVVGAPIAFQTFDPQRQPSQFLLSGAIGTGVVVLIAILRIYLGWAVRARWGPRL